MADQGSQQARAKGKIRQRLNRIVNLPEPLAEGSVSLLTVE